MAEYVITLIAPEEQPLSDALVRAVASAIPANYVDWLAKGTACDFYFALGAEEWQSVNPFYLVRRAIGALLNAYRHALGPVSYAPHFARAVAAVGDAPVDMIVQPTLKRRKHLLIADMDSTMIMVECIDELADFINKKAEVAAITERAMNGELDFAQALEQRVKLLEGLPVSTLERCFEERVTFTPGARTLVQTMRESGAHTVLVSGGFTFFTSRVALALGFHEHRANVLEIKEGQLTGRVAPPILGKEDKLRTLKETCEKQEILPGDALAVGDGANDVPMLLEAGMGVAFHAKPYVQDQVAAQINYCDLTALLYLQGYKSGE